jgi:parallel beta-helix repeat protein
MKMLRFTSVGLRASSLAALLLSTLNFQPSTLFAQGSLTPPGAPGPTMKTLDQIDTHIDVKGEKRIDVLTLAGDASNLFVISAPGSYYLSGNITGVVGKNGISINADDVTVDLNGFALIGVSGLVDGIVVPAAHRNLRIRNGSVQSWGTGINCTNATNSQFDHLRVSNTVYGLKCGNGNVLSEISAEANTGATGAGIFTGSRCTLKACYAANNNSDGFFTGDSCTVTASTSVSNGNGFKIGTNCTIIGCTAASNSGSGIVPTNNCTIKDCTASLNGTGINAGSTARSSIVGCTASQNTGNGIVFGSDSLIMGNNASGNLNDGFHSSGGSLNHIDGNTASHNANDGFLLGNDFVVRNSAFFNTTADYSPAIGTNYGPINSASTSTSPWANFR